jgi:hypothetical protein
MAYLTEEITKLKKDLRDLRSTRDVLVTRWIVIPAVTGPVAREAK